MNVTGPMNIGRGAPRSARIAGVLGVLALTVLAGCSTGGAGYGTKAVGSAPPSATAPAASGRDLGVRQTSLGTVIVDGRGMTAYVYAKDTPGSGRSACSGACLAAWPPITTAASSPSATGVTGKIGTITTDGKMQVTVNGMPIYTNAQDHGPGDVGGQGMLGLWHVVAPDGTVIGAQGSSGGNRGY